MQKYKYHKIYKIDTVCDQRDRRYLISIFLADLIASGIFGIYRMLFHIPVVSAFLINLQDLISMPALMLHSPHHENLLDYTLKRPFNARQSRCNKKIEMGAL